jgi:hypothetical protein
MTMDLSDVAVPAMSAAGGGLTVGWIAKVLIQRLLQSHDNVVNEIRAMVVQLTRVEERVTTLQRTEERTHAQDRILAVMQSQLAEFKDDLNGVGRKVRAMEQS